MPEGPDAAPNVSLSPRQHQVLLLLLEGETNKRIAAALGLSVKTVETHRSNLMQKINCGNLSALVRYAVRNGIIQP